VQATFIASLLSVMRRHFLFCANEPRVDDEVS
jgi:hypothetical protein